MQSPFIGKEVWFLTGSRDLYGARRPWPRSRASRGRSPRPGRATCVGALGAGAEGLDSILRAMIEANSDDSCVGVIAWMHTFSPAKMWIRGLDALAKPLLHFHTQANEALPWSSLDMDFMNLNQSAHGDREFG
jgi:L-arabinose isomerase